MIQIIVFLSTVFIAGIVAEQIWVYTDLFSATTFRSAVLSVQSEDSGLFSRSAESLADVAPKARAAQADANLGIIGYVTRQWRARAMLCLSLFSASLRFSD